MLARLEPMGQSRDRRHWESASASPPAGKSGRDQARTAFLAALKAAERGSSSR